MTTAELGDTGASAENLVFRVMGIDVLLAEIDADRQVGDPFFRVCWWFRVLGSRHCAVASRHSCSRVNCVEDLFRQNRS